MGNSTMTRSQDRAVIDGRYPSLPRDPKHGPPASAWDRLAEIARSLREPQARWKEVSARFMAHEDPDKLALEYRRATLVFNEEIERIVDEVASLTGNASSRVRSVFRPCSEYETWFGHDPAGFLAKVARYSSFNEQYWSDQERAAERLKLVAQCRAAGSHSGELLDAAVAAAAVQRGGVPLVRHGQLGALAVALVSAGVLQPYGQRYRTYDPLQSVCPTRSFAFVVRSDGPWASREAAGAVSAGAAAAALRGDQCDDFVFWPLGRSWQHVQVIPVEALVPANRPVESDELDGSVGDDDDGVGEAHAEWPRG